MQEQSKYHEMLTQLEALASRDLPLDAKLMAHNAMKEEIEKMLGSEQIAKETKHLVDSVIKIDQGFERVKIELGGIDSVRFRGKPVELLQPQWVEHQHRFISLVWRSRTVAKQTGAYVKEFVDVILPTLEDLRNHTEYKKVAAGLTEFAMRKNPFGRDLVLDAKGEMHSPDFTELQCDIKVFRDNFELFNEEQGIELQGDVVLLQEEISDLVWQIKRRKTLIPALSRILDVAILLSDAASSVFAVSALALICPMPSLSIFLSGVIDAVPECIDVVSSISQTNGLREEIHHYHTQLDEKKARLIAPVLIQVILGSQGSAFDDVCGRIDQLSAIWSLVAQDATSIVSDLEQMHHAEDGGRVHKAFVTRVRLVRISYGVLASLLKEYTRQIERHSFRFGQTSPKHESN